MPSTIFAAHTPFCVMINLVIIYFNFYGEFSGSILKRIVNIAVFTSNPTLLSFADKNIDLIFVVSLMSLR